MNPLYIGDVVKNDVQSAVVRWLGTIAGRSLIGLESLTGALPGYTDGTCPIDNERYFTCPDGRGYYILRDSFPHCYKVVQRNGENASTSEASKDDNFHSAPPPPSTSSKAHARISNPLLSSTSPHISRNEIRTDSDLMGKSPSRGILSRLTSDSQLQKLQSINHDPTEKPRFQASTSVTTDSPSRAYRPENYRSTVYDSANVSPRSENNAHGSPRSSAMKKREASSSSSSDEYPSFGQEYFLNRWSFARVKSFLENEIPTTHRFCVLCIVDESHVQSLVDDQMNNSVSFILPTIPKDLVIELTKVFEGVKTIIPSRTLRLRDHHYLLLAIFCSNSQCAYIRTTSGWALIHDDSETDQPRILHDVSDMLNEYSNSTRHLSETCQHVLKNANFLYYKLVA